MEENGINPEDLKLSDKLAVQRTVSSGSNHAGRNSKCEMRQRVAKGGAQ